MFVFGCSNSSDSSGGGCGESASSGTCDIVPEATVCGDRITLECLDGGKPEAESRCQKAISEGDQVIYCCTSAVEATDAGSAATTDAASTVTPASAATTDAATTAGTGGGGGSGG